MTLVVARQTSASRIRVMADTRVTYVDPGIVLPPAEARGVLKAVVISPTTCVSFAGRVDYASDAFLALGAPGADTTDHDAVVDVVLHSHRASRGETDFLVASTTPQPRLTRVADNTSTDANTQGWIGNQAAFSSYQRRYAEHAPPSMEGLPEHQREEIEAASRMGAAFAGIVDDDEFSDVGDLVVSVASGAGGLTYMTKAVAHFAEQAIVGGSGPQTVRFGSAEEGGFAYSMMTPDEPGVGAVAAHYFQGAFGVLWAPLRQRDPIVIRGDHDAFVARVAHDFGFTMSGSRLG